MTEDYEPQPLEPRRVGHPDNPPIEPDSVRAGYASLVRWINKVNPLLPSDQHAHVPFSVQEALVAYIDDYEARMSIARAFEDLEGPHT